MIEEQCDHSSMRRCVIENYTFNVNNRICKEISIKQEKITHIEIIFENIFFSYQSVTRILGRAQM